MFSLFLLKNKNTTPNIFAVEPSWKDSVSSVFIQKKIKINKKDIVKNQYQTTPNILAVSAILKALQSAWMAGSHNELGLKENKISRTYYRSPWC